MGTVRPKSKQGNTTNMNISFSNEGDVHILYLYKKCLLQHDGFSAIDCLLHVLNQLLLLPHQLLVMNLR